MQGREPKKPESTRRHLLVLVISAIVGLAGVYYARAYIHTELDEFRAANQTTESMTEVVVPNRSLTRGETITPDMLSIREIPARFVDSNSVTNDNYGQAVGQRLGYDIDKGSPMLWAHLEGGRTRTFSGQVPEGLRAMTVRVDEINSISGFLQPGDRIDLLLAVNEHQGETIRPIIQNLSVIATGVQTMVDKSYSGGQRVFSTITVEVSPSQAQIITLSQQIGRLTALLRNPDDEQPLDDRPVTRAQLLGLQEKPAPATVQVKPRAQRKTPTIEYIIGGS